MAAEIIEVSRCILGCRFDRYLHTESKLILSRSLYYSVDSYNRFNAPSILLHARKEYSHQQYTLKVV
jgi:hypothetical protein